jgi:hypothetical protein
VHIHIGVHLRTHTSCLSICLTGTIA